MFTIKSLAQMVSDDLSAREIARSVGLDFIRYRAAQAEIQRASTFGGFREQPPTDIEMALGYVSFVLWSFKGTELKDSTFAMMANETARIVSINFMCALTDAPRIVASIQRRVPDFDPPVEAALGIAKDNGPFWELCLTRAVIMVCRSLAYEATGLMGGQLDFPEDMSLKELSLVAYCMLAEALDENTAKSIVAPLGIL